MQSITPQGGAPEVRPRGLHIGNWLRQLKESNCLKIFRRERTSAPDHGEGVSLSSIRSEPLQMPAPAYPEALYSPDFDPASHPAIDAFVKLVQHFGLGEVIVCDQPMYVLQGQQALDAMSAIEEGRLERHLDPRVELVFLERDADRPDPSLAVIRKEPLRKVFVQSPEMFGLPPQPSEEELDGAVEFFSSRDGQITLQASIAPLRTAQGYGTEQAIRYAQLRQEGGSLRSVPSQVREAMRQLGLDMRSAGQFPPLHTAYFDVEGASDVANRIADRAYRATEKYREGHARHQEAHPGMTEAASIYIQSMDSLYTSEEPPL